MKKYIYIIVLIFGLTGCEDVIDLELNTAEPRLVIDASLKWYKETDGSNQYIKLSLSTAYYDEEVPPATGAVVTVTNSNNKTFTFIEEEATGIYRCHSFIPEINENYTLNIKYNDEVYIGEEELMPVASIYRVDQKNDGGFSGDEIELKAFYTDPQGEENYYLFEVNPLESNDLSLDVYDDEFTDGNEIFGFYSDEDLESGHEVQISNSGISERFYEFMVVLLQQTSEGGGGPFETQPATVRGNCVNMTNPENYPFGYFRASEVSSFNYIVK